MLTTESSPRIAAVLIGSIILQIFYFTVPFSLGKIDEPVLFVAWLVVFALPIGLWGTSLNKKRQAHGYTLTGLMILVVIALSGLNYVFYIGVTAIFPGMAAGLFVFASLVLISRMLKTITKGHSR